MAEPRRYRFHPLERRGLLLGLQPAQLATLGVGVLLAVVALRASPGASGGLAAITILVAAAGVALWSIAGRPCVTWAPVATSWLTARRGRRALWSSPRPTAPAGVTICEAPAVPGDDPLGVVRDRRAGTWSAILPVGGRSFTLLDPEDKERRLSAWGALLAATARAGSPIYRIQWVQRSAADESDGLRAYVDQAAPGASGGVLEGAARSYREVIAGAGPASRGHEVLLVLTVNPRRAGRALRAFGGGRDAAVCNLLRRELRLVQGQLRTAEVRPGTPLDRAGVVGALRGDRRRRAGGADSAWPMAVQEDWATVRVDGQWHAVYWVSEWPRLDVGPDFIAPLLLVGGTRAVSVTMAPVAPNRARREVESARTADLADEELRRRAGFLSTARHRREAEGAQHREAELADGHGEYRFSGYVSVGGATVEELDAACAAVEQAAQQSHLELRRLYGQQREALTWTLPLGRGVT